MSSAENPQPHDQHPTASHPTAAEPAATHPPAEAQANQQQWHRVHFLTPILEFWSLLVGLAVIIFVNINSTIINTVSSWADGEHLTDLLVGTAILLGIAVLVVGLSYFWWRVMGFRLDDEEIARKKGVFSTQVRSARFNRIQAVDIVEPFVARIFGLAKVRVETAGGSDSVIEVEYLRKKQAERLRAEVLQRVRGEKSAELDTSAPGIAEPGAPEATLAETPAGDAAQTNKPDPAQSIAQPNRVIIPPIPTGRVLGSMVLRPSTMIAVIVVLSQLFTALNIFSSFVIVLAALGALLGHINNAWQFTATLNETGGPNNSPSLDIAYGLTSRRRQSVPLNRIHAVEIRQPVLWRLTGWWLVQVNVAGYGAMSGSDSGSTMILPVGSKHQAQQIAALVTPLADEQLAEFARPEGFSRPRYTSPKQARWCSPIDYKQQGITLVDDAVIIHHGRIGRSVAVVAEPHIQELSLRRGPVQALLGLRSLRLDLVGGPVRMVGEDLSPEAAEELLEHLRQRTLPELEQAGTFH
ncbi:PH domain-containing protein [Corynebacterium propinquum]|uniref:PH domain-containing protein n=1 Tax=Corynebacterium propinquum TaxID=43769 RepID=UPI0025405D9B|nr:PH domain-containing protein [Corynebacterium propinquum]MDK4258602.1 PH domain-containing protein [Corynebacterium propinquum]MDK4281917.1 PH domain-containing protein [Corynebacterium propinquum]MDK4299299.1 PH domain-containing protein [Corynebacterium propinquum]